MSLFDFFKKSPKKEASKPSSSDNPFASPELQKKRYDAAMEFVKGFRDKTPLLHGRPHAGTVMAAAARLAGTSLYRAINKKDVTPGSVVLSEEVNTAYPQLLNLFAYYCKQNGIDVLSKPLLTEFPEKDKPLMELAQIQTIYQDEYHAIMKKHGLDYLEGARAGMIICSIFFDDLCIKSKAIDPYVATGIVAMGVVEGAKTSPQPLKSKSGKSTATKDKKDNQAAGLLQTVANSSISGSGTRLVVGDGMAAMKEALANGGKYLLVNPGVLSKLEEGNIDPFLVYETALRMELETKISRIDFVNENVDELAQEWSGKSQDQTPMYVRQLLWLKENAEKFGYQQSGNSWKRKN
ncbi:MAG: hypothetical protein WBL25_01025 [Anaerolineales bacterium]